MSAKWLKTTMGNLLPRVPLLKRFIRHQDGAVMVEFGMVVAPFLLLLFMIMETALVFFAGQTLETAAADSARLIKTGQAQGLALTQETFKTAVCARIYGLFDCQKGMYVDVVTYTDFSSIDHTVATDPTTGEPKTQYKPGNAGDIVVVRLMYKWPIMVPLVQGFLGNNGGSTRLLTSTVAFVNEPYN